MDISLILLIALVLIVSTLVVRPTYRANLWIRLYYGLWILALIVLFAKLASTWLEVSSWLAAALSIGCVLLLWWITHYNQDKT